MYCIGTPLYRCRYEVNPGLVPELEANGMEFVGKDETGERMEILELSDNPPAHPFFVAAQFHPEFKSRCDAAWLTCCRGREGARVGQGWIVICKGG